MTLRDKVITADVILDFTKSEPELTQALIDQVPSLIAQTFEGVVYDILLEHHFLGDVECTREYSGVSSTTTTEALTYAIKGHPEGYPKGPDPFADDLAHDGFVRITLTPSSSV